MCVLLQQAYEGLQTAHKLKQEYVFLPAKLKEVYLTYLLEHLEDHKVHKEAWLGLKSSSSHAWRGSLFFAPFLFFIVVVHTTDGLYIENMCSLFFLSIRIWSYRGIYSTPNGLQARLCSAVYTMLYQLLLCLPLCIALHLPEGS